MLGAGTFAQAGFAAIGVGLPAISPALRDHLDLGLTQVGAILSAYWLGTLLTLIPWGFLTDRVGERIVLAAGVGGCGVALLGASRADSFGLLYALLFVAGAAGASVNAATGRAVMGWFDASERGLALGIRQAAVPAGGLVGAFVLPHFTVPQAFVILGCFCLLGALGGAVLLREPAGLPIEVAAVEWSVRDRRLWRLSAVSGLYVVAQIAVLSYVVLYLHDERGLGKGAAAAVLGGMQVAAVVLRVTAGRWSDHVGSRIVPLGKVGLAMTGTLALTAALLQAPLVLLIPAVLVAGSLTMTWNGLAFAAVAELAGRARTGAALGLQQTVLSLVGVGAPIAFAGAVSGGSWNLAFWLIVLFPFAGWLVLRPLQER